MSGEYTLDELLYVLGSFDCQIGFRKVVIGRSAREIRKREAQICDLEKAKADFLRKYGNQLGGVYSCR